MLTPTNRLNDITEKLDKKSNETGIRGLTSSASRFALIATTYVIIRESINKVNKEDEIDRVLFNIEDIGHHLTQCPRPLQGCCRRMWRVACSHTPACTAHGRPWSHQRLGLLCQPEEVRIPHLHLRGLEPCQRLDVQGSRGGTEKDPRNRRGTLHYRALQRHRETLCPRQ